MPIELQQPGMAGLYGAAAVTAKLSKEQKEVQRREDEKMQQQHQMNMKQMDYQLDLEKYERAKRWEIDKMELASQIDFQREEQSRQRKLDGYDNALSQIDKEVQAGRITEKEAEPYKLKINLNKEGVNVSVSEIARQQDEGERTGMPPYWMAGKDAPVGSSMQQLYETKMAEGISGQRTGTVPWDLDPRYIGTVAAEESRVSRGIFLEPEDIEQFKNIGQSQALPLDDKQLDIGVQIGPKAGVSAGAQTGAPQQDLRVALLAEFNKSAQRGDRAIAKELWDRGVKLGYWKD